MRNVLVTGGAGFMGSAFVRLLTAYRDTRVTVLDKLTYASCPEALQDVPEGRVHLVEGDVADADLVETLVAEHDTVVHFAAESHNDGALRSPGDFVHTNLVGTFTILEAARRHDVRFHHVSTDEVFGALSLEQTDCFTESSPYDPSSPYSATKAGSDLLVRAWVRSFGLRATLSNSGNNYGPWQHVEKFIPRQITTAIQAGALRLYGDGQHVRDWIHVDDHAAAVLAILERGRIGETYLIGAETQRSNRDIASMILRAMARDTGDIVHVADRAGHDRRYALDSSKIRHQLGWSPRIQLEEGLRETIAWYAENQAWWRPVKVAVEAAYAVEGK